LRFEDVRCNDPVSGTKVGGKPSGDAEADDATVAFPGSVAGHRSQVTAVVAANDQHTGPGGDFGLEGHADKGDDNGMLVFERETGHVADATAVTEHHFRHRFPKHHPASSNKDANRRLRLASIIGFRARRPQRSSHATHQNCRMLKE
jgi:hypothetical protein